MAGTIIIAHPVSQTWGVIGVLLVALALSAKPRRYGELLPMSATQELKGVAILAVVFGHIGYFLVDDKRFLFPLSIAAGVGVNLFLFLSGYGLTHGMMRRPLSAPEFYRKRALRIFIPFWIALLGFLILDELLLNRTYPPLYVLRSLFGFFPRADMPSDLNSVFWYITWILFYYALFPLLFMHQRAWLSALMLFVLGTALVAWNPSVIELVTPLYAVHTAAFPLGVLVASGLYESHTHRSAVARALRAHRANLNGIRYYAAVVALLALAAYTAYHSGIGEGAAKEQFISMVTTLSLVALFAIKRVELRVLTVVGVYSYEIYLLHWPLVSRHDVLYRTLPAAAATFCYLAVLIAAGWIMQRFAAFVLESPAPLTDRMASGSRGAA